MLQRTREWINRRKPGGYAELKIDMLDQCFLVKNPTQRRIKKVCDSITTKGKVLDIGCGAGHFLKKLKIDDNKKYGIDMSPYMINLAAKRVKDARILLTSAYNIPFEDNTFDAIICSEVLEHLENPKRAVEEMKRVIKPNGEIVITVPNETNLALARAILLRFPSHPEDHLQSFRPKDIHDLFQLKPVKEDGIPFDIPFFLCMHYIAKFIIKK